MKELILNRPRALKTLLAFLFSFPLIVAAHVNLGSPQGFVSDFAGILAPSEVEGLDAKLSAFEKNTGVEIAVVTIQSLEGDTIENFSVELFEEWGIGKKNQDNGVLLLIALSDRQVRIEVGYGLEGVLTDAQSGWIFDNVIKPAFQAGDFAGGINGAVDKIIAAVSGEEIPSSQPISSLPASPFNLFWLILFIPIWLASILGRSKSWWAGGVLGGIAGVILGFIYGFVFTGLVAIGFLIPLGFLFDFIVSRAYARGKASGHFPWWIGGHRGGGFGGGGFGGGGFGGFGGGSSGGAGASGKW